MTKQIDPFTADQILDAAARGESVDGFEDLGEVLRTFHAPATPFEASASLPAAAVVRPAAGRATRRIVSRTGVAASAAVLALGGVAAAVSGPGAFLDPIVGADDGAEEETGDEDTVLNIGYDEDLHLFLWNTSATDGEYDCTLENGPLHLTYGSTDDGITVEDLADGAEGEGATVTFPARDGGGDPLAYSADGPCALQAADVAGPNGQVNHGMFMRLFNSLYEGTGRGCLNRHLARSELGKGDQQIRVGDVDPGLEPVMAGDTAEVDFDTILADCERGPGGSNGNGAANGRANSSAGGLDQDADEDGGEPGGHGRPESPGRSGEAPGRNK